MSSKKWPVLSEQLTAVGHTHTKLLNNALNCLKSGITPDEWKAFIKREYDASDELLDFVLRRARRFKTIAQ